MSVTFFAIDHTGAIIDDLPELNVTNSGAVKIERMLGFRPEVEEYVDIPGGERPVQVFQLALMEAVWNGRSLGHYAEPLRELVFQAELAGADVIAWG
jgi:hypothetical protein